MRLRFLVLAPLFGLADSLGFGSHGVTTNGDVFLGPLQGAGIIISYTMSCIGVLIYAVAGTPQPEEYDTIDIEPVEDVLLTDETL